jgi:hypothetical protein
MQRASNLGLRKRFSLLDTSSLDVPSFQPFALELKFCYGIYHLSATVPVPAHPQVLTINQLYDPILSKRRNGHRQIILTDRCKNGNLAIFSKSAVASNSFGSSGCWKAES